MLVDMQLFAHLAIGVAIVGAYLWMKPGKGDPNATLKKNQKTR